MTQSTMPQIISDRDVNRPISLRNGGGKGLKKNIETIIVGVTHFLVPKKNKKIQNKYIKKNIRKKSKK